MTNEAIMIVYEYKSANGFPVRHQVYTNSLESAEEICKRIEDVNYKLIDVNHVFEFEY